MGNWNTNLSPYEKELLWEQLEEYEETVPMTTPERKELHQWVRQGNSIYSNPWGYTRGDGYPMSYLNALRTDTYNYYTMKELAEER